MRELIIDSSTFLFYLNWVYNKVEIEILDWIDKKLDLIRNKKRKTDNKIYKYIVKVDKLNLLNNKFKFMKNQNFCKLLLVDR